MNDGQMSQIKDVLKLNNVQSLKSVYYKLLEV
jgi:hypothetical protein